MSDKECAGKSRIAFKYNENNKFCIPLNRCAEKGGYVFADDTSSTCVTASTCSSSDPKRYMYAAAGECSTQEPDESGHLNVQDGVYTCDDEYPFLDLTGDKAKCVTEQDCVEPNYVYSDGDTKLCLTSTQCTARSGYILEENGRKCVTAAQCT